MSHTMQDEELGTRVALELNTIVVELRNANIALNSIARESEKIHGKLDYIRIRVDENAHDHAQQFQEFFNRYQIDMRETRGSLWYLPFILIANTAILAYSVFW